MNKIDEIRTLQRNRLLIPGDLVNGRHVVVWGAGVSGKNFIRTNFQINIDLVIDTRTEKQKNGILGHTVSPVSKLLELDPSKTCVVIANEIQESCKDYLIKNGYYIWFVPERFLANHIAVYFDGINKKEFIAWANKEKINYVLDRFSGSFSDIGDLDILVDLKGLDIIMKHECASSEPRSSNSWILDIACASPVGFENELMLYPEWVAKEILQHKVFRPDYNSYVMQDEHKIIALLYHIFVHLGTSAAYRKYEATLTGAAPCLTSELDPKSAFDFFCESPLFPGIDFLRKWVNYTDGDLIKSCLPQQSGQSSIVYILRSGLQKVPYGVTAVLNALSQSHDIISYEIFENYQVNYIKERLRGGIWSDNSASNLGGDPLGYVHVRNKLVLDEVQELKETIRKEISSMFGEEINILHSSDDDYEAEYFLKVILESREFY